MELMAMDGSKDCFNPSFSLVINCDTQDEIDYYWERLTDGGDERAQQCGWLQDKFGLSWQVVPTQLPEMLNNTNPVKAGNVMNVMLKMKKLDLALLKEAYEE